jgi:hypothetical protein
VGDHGRNRARRLVVWLVVALLLLLTSALAACGDDAYRSAVRGVVQELDTAVSEVETLMNGDSAGQQTGADAQAAYRENLEQAMTRMSAAIERASQGIGALTPPDAQARSFQESYLAGLQDYQDGIAQLTEALGYAVGASDVLAGVSAMQVEGGVWAGLEQVTSAGINQQNVAGLASAIEKAKPELAATLQSWQAIPPLEQAKTEHEALAADLVNIDTNVGTMLELARAAAESDVGDSMYQVTLHWELAMEQWGTLLEDLDAWFNKTGGIADSITNQLNGLQAELDRLADTL